MYPYYECDNYPMSITDDDGPFLIMEARLSGDDELNDDFRKGASYRCSCATVSAAIDLCRSMTDAMPILGMKVGRRRLSVIRSRNARMRQRCIGSSRPIRTRRCAPSNPIAILSHTWLRQLAQLTRIYWSARTIPLRSII